MREHKNRISYNKREKIKRVSDSHEKRSERKGSDSKRERESDNVRRRATKSERDRVIA